MKSEDVGRYWERNAETWTRQSRAGYDVYRDALNTPAFLAMLPDVAGMRGLDIGCGEGSNTRTVAQAGARMTGIDIAPTFIRHAREAEDRDPLGIDFTVGDATRLPFDDGSFDFAVAFMSLMDMPDQDTALAEAFRVVRSGGFLQFSILHPCFVPGGRRTLRDAEGNAYAVEISDYFTPTDGDVERWKFSAVPQEERDAVAPFEVPRFHRTLSDWVAMVVGAGFMIEAMGEPVASEEVARAAPSVADTRIAPIFLHMRARKLPR